MSCLAILCCVVLCCAMQCYRLGWADAPCRLQVISTGPKISSGSRYICSPRRACCKVAPWAHSGTFFATFFGCSFAAAAFGAALLLGLAVALERLALAAAVVLLLLLLLLLLLVVLLLVLLLLVVVLLLALTGAAAALLGAVLFGAGSIHERVSSYCRATREL
jgi:hypothetical protein